MLKETELLRNWLACRVRGFSLCRAMPWVALGLLGWLVWRPL